MVPMSNPPSNEHRTLFTNVQLPMLANEIKQQLPLVADGLRKQLVKDAENAATGALFGFNRATAAQRSRPAMPRVKIVP